MEVGNHVPKNKADLLQTMTNTDSLIRCPTLPAAKHKLVQCKGSPWQLGEQDTKKKKRNELRI